MKTKAENIEKEVLKEAFEATCRKRETKFAEEEMEQTLNGKESEKYH